jgi:hypothetical protein
MEGIATNGLAIQCTGKGYIPWQGDNEDVLFVHCYYSAHAIETIISPTDIIINESQAFNAWSQYSNIDTKEGYIMFHKRDSSSHTTYTLSCHNGLWYHHGDGTIIGDITTKHHAQIRKMIQAAQYELYHQRFGCPVSQAMTILYHHIHNVPQLHGNAFYKCLSCIQAKGRHCTHKTHNKHQNTPPTDDTSTITTHIHPGQHFHMDFGFMRGLDYHTTDEKGHLITSIDSYHGYLLIIDKYS